jgi:hypothetical protein
MNGDSPAGPSPAGATPPLPDQPSVLMLSRDLLFASRVKSAARAAGLNCRIASRFPDEQADSIRLVILDLSTLAALAGELVLQCAQRCPTARLIAYGPHVQVDNLQAARQAGIATVMTNGQFSRELSQLLSLV